MIDRSRVRQLLAGRKKRLLLVAAIAVVFVGGLGTYSYLHSQDSQKGYDTSSEAYQRLKELQAQPIPSDGRAKALYHVRVAEAYDSLGDTENALESLLTADKYASEAKIDLSLNLAIARHYEELGDTREAREYYQREVDRLTNNEFRDENAGLIESLKTEKDRL